MSQENRDIYNPQTKFAKVMFPQVSVCPQGGTWAEPLGQVHPLGRYTYRAGTPPRLVHTPQGRYTPLGSYTPRQLHPWAATPPGRYTPGQVHPPGRYTPLGRYTPGRYTPPHHSSCWDTVNKRAVRIPLECILVLSCGAKTDARNGQVLNFRRFRYPAPPRGRHRL